jgi:Helix-turn-helix domain
METLLRQRDAAAYLQLTVRTLERWRVQGIGPRFVRLNHSIRYRQQDLDAHVASRVVGSTSEQLENGKC